MTSPHRITRRTDPETSFIAAKKVVTKSEEVRRAVKRILERSGPLTHDEIALEYRRHRGMYGAPFTTDSSIRSRTSELVARGEVEACGYGVSFLGGTAILWAVKPDNAGDSRGK